jgi:hypothetical protein
MKEDTLAWANSFKYLGNHLSRDLQEAEDVSKKRGELFGRTNLLLSNARGTPSCVISKIFIAQCAHMYGAETWSTADTRVPLLFTALNRCLKRIHTVENSAAARQACFHGNALFFPLKSIMSTLGDVDF